MGGFYGSDYALFYGTRGDRLFSKQVRPGNRRAVANVQIDGIGRDGVRASRGALAADASLEAATRSATQD
jgi:hypothetical protein